MSVRSKTGNLTAVLICQGFAIDVVGLAQVQFFFTDSIWAKKIFHFTCKVYKLNFSLLGCALARSRVGRHRIRGHFHKSADAFHLYYVTSAMGFRKGSQSHYSG